MWCVAWVHERSMASLWSIQANTVQPHLDLKKLRNSKSFFPFNSLCIVSSAIITNLSSTFGYGESNIVCIFKGRKFVGSAVHSNGDSVLTRDPYLTLDFCERMPKKKFNLGP